MVIDLIDNSNKYLIMVDPYRWEYAGPTRDIREDDGDMTMRSLLSYVVMRLIQPDAGWSLRIMKYSYNHYLSREWTNEHTGMVCVNNSGDVINTMSLGYDMDILRIDRSDILCSIQQMYELYPDYPSTLDLNTWVDAVEDSCNDQNSIHRSLIRTVMINRYPMVIPDQDDDVIETLGGYVSTYSTLVVINNILAHIPPPGYVKILNPRYGIWWRSDVSFLLQ